MPEQRSRLVIEIDSAYAKQNAQALARELESIEKKGEFATKSMDSMSVATRNLAGYMAGLVTVGSAISKMDAYTGINNKLKLVTKSQEELNQAMSDTFAIAQRSASAWGAVNDVYSKYMSNAKTLNLSQEQTARLTEITSKAVAISGSSAESAAAALFQYGQALDGGVLRAEEFNSLVDGAGGLLNAMATGLGVTRGELRQMMLDGKLTGEVITKALLKAGDSVDELFGKTDLTIGQSFAQLNNAVTKFVGESGKASGSAQVLTSSISMLSQNLESIANIGMLGGVALLTKAIVTQTVAVQASINATIEKRLAMTADLQMQTQLAAMEVQRTRLAAAQALTEVNLARAEYNSAVSRTERAAATMRLTQAEIAHNLAVKGNTVAIAAQTQAENALNASRAVGARMLSLVGGWTGVLTIGITALAAGYMYFSSRAAEANKKLEEQANVAKKANEELMALKGLEKDNAINDMTASFERQNKALAESSSKINMQLTAIERLYKGNKEVVQVVQDARNGTISMTDAVKRFNELRISKDIYDSVKANTVEFEKNAKEATNTKNKLNLFGIEVELAGRKAQTSVAGLDENTKALKGNKNAAEEAAKAQKNFKSSLFDREFDARLASSLLAKGYTPEQVSNMVETANWARKNSVTITNDLYKTGLQVLDMELKNKAVIDAKNNAEKDRTKELEKQQKVLQINSKVQANAAKYNFSSTESKYNLPQGTLSALHMIESKGNANAYNKSTGATGGFQFLSGTAKQYGVKNRNDLGQSAEGAGKYMSYLLDLFKGDLEKAVRAYHAGEGNVQKGKNIGKYNNQYWSDFQGYMAGINGFSGSSKDFEKTIEDYSRLLDEQAKSRKSLELQVADEVTKIRENLADKLLEIDKAGFTPEKSKELKSDYQARAEDEIAIAQYALKTKIDDYAAFKKTEDDLLKDSFNQKKFYISRDAELSKKQKEEAIRLLDEQYQYELGLIQLTKEQRIFQFEQAMYSEMDLIQKRYEFELRESEKIKDPEEKSRRINAARLDKKRAENDLTKSLTGDYLSVMGFDENPLIKQFEVLQRARENDLINEEQYQNAKLQLQAKSTASYLDGMFGGFAELVDENSRTYAVLFAAQKAFAVAQAMLNIPAAYSKAYDAVVGTPYVGPYIAPAVGAAAAALQVAQAASMKSVNLTGMAHNGIDNIPREGTWLLDGGERVLNPQQNTDLTKYLADQRDTNRLAKAQPNAINSGAEMQAERQAQANAKVGSSQPQIIDNQLRVIMVKNEDDAKDILYSPDGQKAFLYHMKRTGYAKR
jgi:tape measure domain-containing protein